MTRFAELENLRPSVKSEDGRCHARRGTVALVLLGIAALQTDLVRDVIELFAADLL